MRMGAALIRSYTTDSDIKVGIQLGPRRPREILEANQPRPGTVEPDAPASAASGSDAPLGTDENPVGGGAKAKAAAQSRKQRASRGKKQRQARAKLRDEGLEPPKRQRLIAWEAIRNARPATAEAPKRPTLIPKEEQELRKAKQPAETMDVLLEMKRVLKGETVPPDDPVPLSISAEVRLVINNFSSDDTSVSIRQEYVRKCQNLWPYWEQTLGVCFEWAVHHDELDKRMGTRSLLILPQHLEENTDIYDHGVKVIQAWAKNHSNPDGRTPQEMFDDDFVDCMKERLHFAVAPGICGAYVDRILGVVTAMGNCGTWYEAGLSVGMAVVSLDGQEFSN